MRQKDRQCRACGADNHHIPAFALIVNVEKIGVETEFFSNLLVEWPQGPVATSAGADRLKACSECQEE